MLENPARLRMLVCGTALMVGLYATTSSARAQCNCGGSASGGFAEAYSMDLPPGIVGQILEGDSIYLTVNVPEKAIIHVNGDPTISVGATRYFVIRGLEPEKEYEFKIVVETANAAGVAMEETKEVKLKPGTSEIVSMKPVKRKVLQAAVDVSVEASVGDPSPGDGARDAGANASGELLRLSAKRKSNSAPPH